jgi:hypothetical protein
MNARHRVLLPACAALLATVVAHPGLAAERVCSRLTIATDAGFRDRFGALAEHIAGELSARSDIESCARVALQLQTTALIGVSVTLPDGRTAQRSVAAGDDVLPTLQALLLLPEPERAAPALPERSRPRMSSAKPAAAKHRTWRATGSVGSAVGPTTAASDRGTPLTDDERHLGFELSLVGGARVGDGQVGYGGGALSLLEVEGWLFGFEGRVDAYQSVTGSDPDSALELALLAGKRFDLGAVALDLTAGPGVAAQGVSVLQGSTSHTQRVSQARTETTAVAPAPTTVPQGDPDWGPLPRLLLAARLGFNPRSMFRTFVGLDAEFGPSTETTPLDSVPPAAYMPSFVVGLALGATLGTP